MKKKNVVANTRRRFFQTTLLNETNSRSRAPSPDEGCNTRLRNLVNVAVGERVAAGQTLAQLDTGPFAAAAAQMRAALTAAQANYTKTAAGARPQVVAQTNARIQGAKTQLAVAQSNLARQQQLLHLGIASQVDGDTAKTTVARSSSPGSTGTPLESNTNGGVIVPARPVLDVALEHSRALPPSMALNHPIGLLRACGRGRKPRRKLCPATPDGSIPTARHAFHNVRDHPIPERHVA